MGHPTPTPPQVGAQQMQLDVGTLKQTLSDLPTLGQANATGTKMEMTTPVFTKENTMQFVVSGESMDALPASTNEKVVLQEEKGGIFVAKKFSGVATEESAREVEAELRKCAARDGLETSGNAALAQYNDPFTNPLVRRNEIIIPVSNFAM